MTDRDLELTVKCSCLGSCGILKLSKFDWEDDGTKDVCLEYFEPVFFTKQDGIFRTLIHRIKLGFYMLIGREFSLFDMILDEKEVKNLKNYLVNLLEDDNGTSN